jgi:uncharacterized protein (TIGR00369 family)
MSDTPRHLTPAELTVLIETHFPQVQEGNGPVTIERSDPAETIVRMAADQRIIRPGGTVSGPAMFKLADFGVYVALLGRLGEAALQAVTTSMTINFLSRPHPGDLIAEVRILKLGRRLAVAEARLRVDGREDIIAHATSTYALPPDQLKR